MIPSLLAASDVLGTGWFAADAAEAGAGKSVVVVGDGAVGLMGVLAAKQMGSEHIIAMSRHASRQALAREFGATDIVEERGAAGVAKVKELTGGFGAHSVIEAVGTQGSMMQAISGAGRVGTSATWEYHTTSNFQVESCSLVWSIPTVVRHQYDASYLS